MAGKPELRKALRERIAQLTPSDAAEKSARICEAIARHPVWQQARTVGLFAAQASEPHVELLWKSVAGQKICYPRVNGTELDFILVSDPSTLEKSRWQLREPIHDEARIVAPENIDLLLVPGLAFSKAGGRLGRGGGFYDRLLARREFRAHKIGVCFDVQLTDALPIEAHDREVDEVITESGLLGSV